VLAWPAALVLDATLGEDVLVVRPHDAEGERAAARALWEAEGRPTTDRDVARLHGEVLGADRVLATGARLRRPAEKPSLVLYRTDADGGARPFQARTAWYLARALAAAGAGAAVLLFVAAGLVARARERRASRAAR
jgi:hypothetical protein